MQRHDRRRGAGEKCIRRETDEFCRVGLEESWIVRSKAVVDPDILPVDPPEPPQCLRKGSHTCPSELFVLGPRHQPANTANPLLRLCVCSKRPRRRPAKKGDESAPSHSMTSSARSSMPGGTVRPSALAVLRFMISEYFVGS
jgi:hypothetical protein